jgi:hypothetical protein
VTAAAAANHWARAAAESATVFYRPETSSGKACVAATAAGAIAFDCTAPYRGVRTFRGQRNYCGFWWFARTKRHVTFESWCERDHLIALDFDPSVCAVAEQPFTMRFAAVEGGQREHTPDFFVRSVSGASIVMDVRPQDLIDPTDREKFDVTAELCRIHGWEYRQVGEPRNPWIANVRWLAGYRHERACTESIAEIVRAIGADSGPRTIGDVADAAGEPIAVLPTIFNLMWTHELQADLVTRRLSFDTLVVCPSTS